MPDIQIFICWSGERSRHIAEKLESWLPGVISEGLKPFVSKELEKGIAWFPAIVKKLEESCAGIICLTPENFRSPWLHFEAGALARQLTVATPETSQHTQTSAPRIYTYLHGVRPAQLTGPLANYQSTTTTREDTARLVESLAELVSQEQHKTLEWHANFQYRWPELEALLESLQLSVPEVFSEFESLFQRKTFNEPLQQCADQSWIGRYDGARHTWEALHAQLQRVRDACPRHQVDLYEMLIAQVDGYAMVTNALLLKSKVSPFDLAPNGELIIPPGILQACERRRLRVKELVSRILDPLSRPLTEDAVRFHEAEQFVQKKAYVHRLEHRIIHFKDDLERKGKPDRGDEVIKSLVGDTVLHEYRTSGWDLDRIYAHLIAQYLQEPTEGAVRDLAEAVRMELETANATGETPSLMPLHYALGALADVLPEDLPEELRTSVKTQIQGVEDYLDGSLPVNPATGTRPTRDTGGQIHRTLRYIQAKLADGRS